MANNMNNTIVSNGSKGSISIHDVTYHMDWDTLQSEQPGKVPVLTEWWKETGEPAKHGTPVYDVEDRVVYPSYGLHPGDANYTKIRFAVINSIDTGKAAKFYEPRQGKEKIPYDGHHFLAAEDVPINILQVALEDYRKKKNVLKKGCVPRDTPVELLLKEKKKQTEQMRAIINSMRETLNEFSKLL